VEYDDRIKISEICSELDVDGLRGDMVRAKPSSKPRKNAGDGPLYPVCSELDVDGLRFDMLRARPSSHC